MNWTTEKPTKPGWYPYKMNPKRKWQVVRVSQDVTGLYVSFMGGQSTYMVHLDDDAQWAGPIEEPT